MDSLMARLLAEARGREKASLKEEKEDKEEVKEDEELEENKEKLNDKEEMNMGDDAGKVVGKKEDAGGLLVHGLKGRKPKLSEEKKEEMLTEETIRWEY